MNKMQKTALVLGGQGFIGSNLVKKLKDKNYWVRSVDTRRKVIHMPDQLLICNLTDPKNVETSFEYPKQFNDRYGKFDEVYCLSSDTDLANFNSDRIINSQAIFINVARKSILDSAKKIFYASGNNIYDLFDDFIISDLIRGYKKEKKFAEYIFSNIHKDYNINTKIGRLDNIFGPGCSLSNYEESVVSAICIKIIKCTDSEIKINIDSDSQLSCLYIDDCIDQIITFMNNDDLSYYDISSQTLITTKDLVKCIIEISGKNIVPSYKDTINPKTTDLDTIIYERLKLTYKDIEKRIVSEL